MGILSGAAVGVVPGVMTSSHCPPTGIFPQLDGVIVVPEGKLGLIVYDIL